MKKVYEAPMLDDLGSLEELTQGISLLGISLDGDGTGGGGGGSTLS